MWTFLMVFIATVIVGYVSSTIGGLTYMDNQGAKNKSTPKDDLCNPVYWFPKPIPEYCFHKDTPPLRPPPQIIPVPLPVQLPPVGVSPLQPGVVDRRAGGLPMPGPFPGHFQFPPVPPAPMPLSMPYLPPGPPDPCICTPCPLPPIAVPIVPMPPQNPCCPACPPLAPPPMPMYNPQPIPFGVPLAPTNPMVPVPGYSYNPYNPYAYPNPYYPGMFPPPPPMAGMVPGIPGLVSDDGGINVLPFSDAYSDYLEKRKQKEFNKKYRHIIREYKKKHYKSESSEC